MIHASRLLLSVLTSASVLTACGSRPDASSSKLKAGHDYDYRQHIELTDIPEVSWDGEDYGSPYFRGVMSHTTDWYLQSSPTTNAHETAHGLHSEMRNKTSEYDNFLYLEDGKGVYVLEPQMHMSYVASYLPAGAQEIASMRYDTYLISQAGSWSEVLYLFDEWTAYIVNARVALEMYNAGSWSGEGVDEVDGAMDFLYFCSAAVLALRENEPDYLQQNRQFKATFAALAESAMKQVKDGLQISYFNGFHASELRQHFISSPENSAIRQALKEIYGAGWTQRVLGF